MIPGSGCSKSRLAKAAGAEVAVQQRNEKWHAAVARSAFASKNAQNISGPEQLFLFRCPKLARRRGAKRILCQNVESTPKHLSFGGFLEVQISKNDNPLWREAHLQVKMHKAPHVRTTF